MGRARTEKNGRSRAGDRAPAWADWSDEKLLDLRMCDLRVRLETSFYREPIAQLSRELAARKLLFRPYFWLSDVWYAQSHPDEDFAETFAVWLDPNSAWRERYRGWPVLKKLEYMDRLMGELAGVAPYVTERQQVDPLGRLYSTLRDHYEDKRKHYGIDRKPSYDADLKKLFSDAPVYVKNPSAATFLHRTRKEIRRRVAEWTGEYQYTIDQVLEGMIDRCQALNLRLTVPKEQAKLDFAILLTVQTMNYLQSGRHKVAL